MLLIIICVLNRNDIISWETAEDKENVYYHPDLLVSDKTNLNKTKINNKTSTDLTSMNIRQCT